VHLFSDIDESYLVESSGTQTDVTPSKNDNPLIQRVTALEQQVASLIEQVDCLTELLEDK
jgi:uncharacterized protein YceH (UPF0502 family)